MNSDTGFEFIFHVFRDEQDSENGTYALTDFERYPTELQSKIFLRPWEMSDDELKHWIDHIRAGQPVGQATSWRFVQPRPGEYDRVTRTLRHKDSQLQYPAASLAYARWVEVELARARDAARRGDELPVFSPSNLYRSISDQSQMKFETHLGKDEQTLVDLLRALKSHDLCGPAQVSKPSLSNYTHVALFLIDGPGDAKRLPKVLRGLATLGAYLSSAWC